MEDRDLYILANYFNICVCVYESDHKGIIPIVFNSILPVEYQKDTIAKCDRKIYLFHTGDHFDTLFPKSMTLSLSDPPDPLVMSSKDILDYSMSVLSEEDLRELTSQVQTSNSTIQSQDLDQSSLFPISEKEQTIVFPDEVQLQEQGQMVETPEQGQIVETPEQGQIVETPEQGQIVETPEQGQMVETPEQGQIVETSVAKRKKRGRTPKIKTLPMFADDYTQKEKMVRNVIERCFSKYRIPDYLVSK